MITYYPRLRDLRKKHGYTQKQIAALLRVHQTQYSRYERGVVELPSDFLIYLARLYKTSADYILERTDNPKPYDDILP